MVNLTFLGETKQQKGIWVNWGYSHLKIQSTKYCFSWISLEFLKHCFSKCVPDFLHFNKFFRSSYVCLSLRTISLEIFMYAFIYLLLCRVICVWIYMCEYSHIILIILIIIVIEYFGLNEKSRHKYNNNRLLSSSLNNIYNRCVGVIGFIIVILHNT